MTTRRRARLQGVVAEYDDHAGFGVVEAGEVEPAGSDAMKRYWFHCTQIEDGSRHAEPGQVVTFRVSPGHNGRWEAAEIT